MFDSLDMICIAYCCVLHTWIIKLLQSQADNIKIVMSDNIFK